MSAAGNCYDNAAMESFWSTLKTEWLHQQHFQTHHQAHSAIFDYIETFYNPKRLHSALGYLSPVDFERINPMNNHEKSVSNKSGQAQRFCRWQFAANCRLLPLLNPFATFGF